MIEHKTGEKVELPENLVRQINMFECRLRFMETAVAIFGGLCALLATYALLFLSDRLWDTPTLLRLLLTCLGALAFLAFGWFWVRHWLWHRRNKRDLVRMVQRAHGTLGDRLLGIVELSDGGGEGLGLPGNISPALCRAAIRQVASEAEKIDFKAAVSIRRPRMLLLSFLLLAALVGGGVAIFPQAGWNALLRWFKPMASVERYTFVRLEDMPDRQVVPYGEEFQIACRLDPSSRWKPGEAVCQYEDQLPIEAKVRSGVAVFSIPGQTSAGNLDIRIGDVSRSIRIVPMYRPELVLMQANVNLPDYLRLPPRIVPLNNASAHFVKGSQVVIEGRSERSLSKAVLQRPDGNVPCAITNDTFYTPALPMSGISTNIFTWTDSYNLDCAVPYTLELASRPDAAPDVTCEGISRSVAILQDEVVKLKMTAQDDFGVQRLWLEWRIEGGQDRDLENSQRSVKIADGAPDRKELLGEHTFSPTQAHIPEGSLVSVYAASVDYLTGREPTHSQILQIYVLSRSEHADLLREQMQEVQSRMEDITREEERLINENEALLNKNDKDLESLESSRKLKANQRDEEFNAEELKRAAEKIDELAQEALRNSDIPESTLREWSQFSQSMKQLSSGAMSKASQFMQSASSKSSAKDRAEDIEQAIEEQMKALEQLRKMQKETDSSLQNMAARNFVNRLRKAGKDENELVAGLQNLLPRVIGLRTKDLGAQEVKELGHLVSRQDDVGRQAGYIQDDLQGFFNLTREEIFSQIVEEMSEQKMKTDLRNLTHKMKNNTTSIAMEQSANWAGQFNEWADRLEKNSDGDSGAEGGDGAEEAEIEIETLMALMRARVQQESMREQTRLAEESRPENKMYTSDVRALASRQFQMAGDIGKFEQRTSNPKAKKFIGQISALMKNVGSRLNEPRTDSMTIAMETQVIEAIAAAIQSSTSQSQGMMAGMMEGMMPGQKPGSKTGNQGGGNDSGGTTDRANNRTDGQASGADGLGEGVDKAAGMGTSSLPAEFRDMLESYLRKVEDN